MAVNIIFWEISKLRKLIISLLLSAIILGGHSGHIAFAELLPCEVGDFSKGDWGHVVKDGTFYIISPDTDKIFTNFYAVYAKMCCPELGCAGGSAIPCNIPACTYENARYKAQLRSVIGTYWGMSCQQEDIYTIDPLTGLHVLTVKKCHSVGDCINKALTVSYDVFEWVCKENPPSSEPNPVLQFGPHDDICRE